jgi:peptidoglycan/xylan/chitin deacetylase (PgdA/CDA1 family)
VDRRRFLLGAAPAVLVAGVVGATAMPASSSSTRPFTKARRGVGLGTQLVHWSAPVGTAVLTFDDGPYPALTPQVLDILDRYGISATFMLVGAFAAAEPGLLDAILERGHAVGNHTWTHRDLTSLDPAEVRVELQRTHEVLSRHTEITVFRPPRGQLSGVALQAAAELDYDVVLWSTEELEPIVSGTLAVWHDGLGRGGFLAEGDPERRRRHDDRTAQIAALPAAIEAALEAGVRFVPLDAVR